MTRPPLPPFDETSAHAKVLAAEAWFRSYGNENWEFGPRTDGDTSGIPLR